MSGPVGLGLGGHKVAPGPLSGFVSMMGSRGRGQNKGAPAYDGPGLVGRSGAVVNHAPARATIAKVIAARPCLRWCLAEWVACPGMKLGRWAAVSVKYRTPATRATIAT